MYDGRFSLDNVRRSRDRLMGKGPSLDFDDLFPLGRIRRVQNETCSFIG